MPAAGLTEMNRFGPLSVMVSDGVVQVVVFRSVLRCNSNPVEEEGHETITNALDRAMFSEGAESP